MHKNAHMIGTQQKDCEHHSLQPILRLNRQNMKFQTPNIQYTNNITTWYTMRTYCN